MRFDRSLNLIGEEAFARLRKSSVAVFGIGGVGGFVAEALARSGVEHLAIVDKDLIDESNINRQIIALDSTIGHQKVQVMQNRIRDINPYARVDAYCEFYLPDNADFIDLSIFDYVVDAMDNVTANAACLDKPAQEFAFEITNMDRTLPEWSSGWGHIHFPPVVIESNEVN